MGGVFALSSCGYADKVDVLFDPDLYHMKRSSKAVGYIIAGSLYEAYSQD